MLGSRCLSPLSPGPRWVAVGTAWADLQVAVPGGRLPW